MAKVQLTDAVLKAAIAAHCEAAGKEFSEGEHAGLKAFVLMPGDIIAYQEAGKLICPDQATYEALSEILMDMAQESTRGPNLPAKTNGHITSRSQAGSAPGSSTNAAQAIQIMQAGKDLTYTVSKKQAPNATMALMAATDAKIDLVEVNAIPAGNGVGPKKAAAILEKFDLKLEGKYEISIDGMLRDPYALEDCRGIGELLAARIREKIAVIE